MDIIELMEYALNALMELDIEIHLASVLIFVQLIKFLTLASVNVDKAIIKLIKSVLYALLELYIILRSIDVFQNVIKTSITILIQINVDAH